jgi:threonine dehydrogenase-like Zn-dependent dehydrogenase
VLLWSVMGLAKAGTLAIIGVYPPTARRFPIGMAMNKNLSLRMGNCPHRKYLPLLDRRSPGWVKVELQPQTH